MTLGFTLRGDLTSANIVIQQITSEGAVTYIDIRCGDVGSAAISAINTSSTFTLNVWSGCQNLTYHAETINASAAISITLGAVTEDARRLKSRLRIRENAFTLNGTAYEKGFDMSPFP